MKKLIVLILAAVMLLSITACGGAEAKSVDLQQIYSSYESTLPAMMVLDEGTMMNFLGISAEDCTQVVAAICADGLRADEVWLIEAVSAEAAARLEGLAKNRIQQKDDESVNYSPEQNAIVKKSLVKVAGNYVFFICSPEVEAMQKAVNTALGN